MSRVVLRCPACGTTQSAAGECETCHEDDVRYYCTNHSPGVWLDVPVCTRCGARFGEAPLPPPPRRPRPDIRPPRPDGTVRPPAVPRVPPPREPARDEDSATPPALADVLFEMLEEGERKRASAERTMPRRPAGPPRAPFPVLGCLGRLVLLVLIVVVLGLAGLFLLLGGALS